MLGPQAVQNLQLSHPQDWQGWAQLELTDALIVTSFYFIFLSEGGFISNAYNDKCNCSLHNKRPEQAFLFGRFSVLATWCNW